MAVTFPILRMAMEVTGLRGYELADVLKVDTAVFSRKIHGRVPFLPHERARLSELLGISENLLFKEMFTPRAGRLGQINPGPIGKAVENAMAAFPNLETR